MSLNLYQDEEVAPHVPWVEKELPRVPCLVSAACMRAPVSTRGRRSFGVTSYVTGVPLACFARALLPWSAARAKTM